MDSMRAREERKRGRELGCKKREKQKREEKGQGQGRETARGIQLFWIAPTQETHTTEGLPPSPQSPEGLG